MKNGKSAGYDGIGTFFLKKGVEIISPIIVTLINSTIAEGTFPKCLKIAMVVAIHKKGSTELPSNYRPISLLSNISKIFEKILYCRLVKYLEKIRV